jgi:hypothetical protein
MSSPERAYGGDPPEWLVDRELNRARERACVGMLLDLATGRIDPRGCLPAYMERIDRAFDAREAELEVPFITQGRQAVIDLRAVREARLRHREEAGSYIRDLIDGLAT